MITLFSHYGKSSDLKIMNYPILAKRLNFNY